MVIEFLCPNGHKIRCADDRANKPAKCPKCGVKFYVPGPEESEPSESGSWATAPVQASGSPGSSSSKLASREQIEFLCPNGHRLWAAVGLQGRPGQCPECGSKFHIPTLADYEQRPPATRAGDSVINLEDFAATVLGGNSSGRPSGVLPLAGGRASLQSAAAEPSPAVGFRLAWLEDYCPRGNARTVDPRRKDAPSKTVRHGALRPPDVGFLRRSRRRHPHSLSASVETPRGSKPWNHAPPGGIFVGRFPRAGLSEGSGADRPPDAARSPP